MSDPKKALEMFDGPLGILPDGKLNTVSRDAPPFEPTLTEADDENGPEASEEDIEAMLAEKPIDDE